MIIAGHSFTEQRYGRVCGCGKRWADIMSATPDAIDQFDWAHEGRLLDREYREIEAERDRLWCSVMEAAGA